MNMLGACFFLDRLYKTREAEKIEELLQDQAEVRITAFIM